MGQKQSYEDGDSQTSDTNTMDSTDALTAATSHFRLLDLPSELVDQILTYLSPVALCRVSQCCKNLHTQASAPRLWKSFLAECIPYNNNAHKPYASWKELYGTHYPYWFLPKHKVWFSDKTVTSNPLIGQIMLARYDYRIGSIEGYRLVAEHSANDSFIRWTHDPNVLIHHFDPRVSIFLDDPVVKLDRGAFEPGHNRLRQEVLLTRADRGTMDSIKSRLFPTISIPTNAQVCSMSLWPPSTIPAPERVRNESPSLFQDPSHKPRTLDEMSTTTFRIRKWLDFGSLNERLGIRTAEDVMCYSTLMPEYYTPTAKKPYQGLWVGDYAGHGCEFLVIIQSTPSEAASLPPVIESPPRRVVDGLLPHIPIRLPEASEAEYAKEAKQGLTGRLDAIKLTGDPNIPRGQPSWIAEDIGRSGLLRVAEETEFRGARVVKSAGHIAAGGFRNDRYTPSQLIMISVDKLAMYWVEMGHMSYFKRIHIDDYLRLP